MATLVGVEAVILALLPFVHSPRFRDMYEAFAAELPVATELALSAWFMPACAGALLLGVVWALRGRRRATPRRATLVGALCLGAGAIALYFWAVYAPIFVPADTI